jgi:hypothetical protein
VTSFDELLGGYDKTKIVVSPSQLSIGFNQNSAKKLEDLKENTINSIVQI